MANQQPPEWWLKQREPRFGCADVTIVAVVAIAAFIILILILSKADFAGVVEQLPLGGSTTATAVPTNISNASPDDTATALALQAITPKPLPTNSPTPNPNGAIGNNPDQAVALTQTVLTSGCDVLIGDKPVANGDYITTSAGWEVSRTGRTTDAQGTHYVEIEITDLNAAHKVHTQGWVESKCLKDVSVPNSA